MTVKMAIPNKGRLNERSIELITKAGINLGDDWGRKLNIKVPDLDLEVFFVRAQDIPIFIDSGAVDFGITGQDVTAEAGKELKNVLNLRFGQCRLSIAAPEESAIARTGKMEDGIRVVQQLLAEGIRPDGILCGEDLTAAGVLKSLLRAGIRVPEETAVVGYDNSTYARLCEPELTSVDNKPEQVALLCVQLLQSRIEHGEDYSSVTLQPELVQRQSS